MTLMNNYLYLLVNDKNTEFKIGVTDDITERYLKLSFVWGEFELPESYVFMGTRDEVERLEKTLHFMLENWRIEKVEKLDGRREWFSMKCFEKAIEIIAFVASMRGLKLEERLIRGVTVNRYRKHDKKIKKITTKPNNYTNPETVKKQWILCYGATIDFKDHPKFDDSWLWVIKNIDCQPSDFIGEFNIRNKIGSFSLVPSAYIYNSEKIIEAVLQKSHIEILKEDESLQELYEYLSTDISNMISKFKNQPPPSHRSISY